MSYTALARRYRSQAFDQVVGQEPIAQTLRNAIATNRLHHAYLFTGTRGVGKTTMARLFARALNAPQSLPDMPKVKGVKYPPAEVQGRMAEAIMRGDDLNVIEIDAASNTGVDNVRQLIANASLVPTDNAAFKVYIIDEVHMLSNAAFNALLKIMEEPPSHVKFILATTDAHKVPATIVSRCQRYDFRNIATARIAAHLTEVLGKEKVGAEPAVVHQIAAAGNGSMRDALSLLDRLLAAGEDPLTADLLERMLGLPDRTQVARLVDAVADSNPGEALRITGELLGKGIGQDQLLATLTDYVRDLMLLASAGAETDLVDLDEQTRATAVKQAERFDPASAVHMIALLENVAQRSRYSSVPRALLDAAVVRLALSERFALSAALLNAEGAAVQGVEKKKVAAGERPVSDRATAPLTPAIAPAAVAMPAPTRPAPARPSAVPQPPAPPGVSRPAYSSGPSSPRPAPIAPPPASNRLSEKQRDAILNQPLVKQVADLFDARLTAVQPLPKPAIEPPADDDAEPDGA